MRSEFRDGHLYLRREPGERLPLLRRLRRIEGQVRGIQAMIEQDRYCGDELQQASAVIAAMQEVVRLLSAQHLEVGLEHAASSEGQKTTAISDMQKILKAALRHR